KSDLEVVWPLLLTVKIEYDLANAQLEFMGSKAEKEVFLKAFEEFIRKKYFKEVIKLNYFQGKLLILLIHKELGKTAYELLKEYRNVSRANFWQSMASMFGASLKEEYHAASYPLLNRIFQEKSQQAGQLPVIKVQ
ncbi:MAG: DUF4294 domain-containing protein, partial [Prolixibacteraceae bacterium]|nr:DUF4294 domain-containing protein [Prolixibacteraceae bacterium]